MVSAGYPAAQHLAAVQAALCIEQARHRPAAHAGPHTAVGAMTESRRRVAAACLRIDMEQTRNAWLTSRSFHIDCAFSKLARTCLRHIRVSSKEELRERILNGIAEINGGACRNPLK